MTPLISEGRVFIAQAPLYKIESGKRKVYLYSDEELQRYLKENPEKRYSMQMYKGLGEMNPEQLWETTMDPARRKMLRIDMEDAEVADSIFSILMGNEVGQRREFIQRHALSISNLDV